MTGVHLTATEHFGSLSRGSGKAVSHLFPSSGLHGHSGAENRRFSFGHSQEVCCGQSHQFNSLVFPIFLLYHTADLIVEETRQTSLLRAPALGTPLLLPTPLISLAYTPDVPNPQCAIVGGCVQQLIVDLDAVDDEFVSSEDLLQDTTPGIEGSCTGITAASEQDPSVVLQSANAVFVSLVRLDSLPSVH